ncbi:ABC transporter ATP-binding protein [Kamptonema cortianum]|nr:ABC transporter ATP-binding protein [Geitlerinema splendidum]MDK3160444.1 ABC transporter ATP-binding protein [Kamptonema cortianum]
MSALSVNDLHVAIRGTEILRGVSFSLEAGKTLGVVGESGCGKSMTGLAIMGMLPPGGSVTRGTIHLDGRELTQLRERDWIHIRGQSVALVMQDPFTSLNPVMRVGEQIAEVFQLHKGFTPKQAKAAAIEMIAKVGVPSPADSAKKYPHQMSGGQRQRIVIAIAFAAKPKVLIADEPTTALDVTLQAQILRLLKSLQEEENTAVMLISHDIGVIGSVSDDIAVYYAGRVVESGSVSTVIGSPSHPYTQALLQAMPKRGQGRLSVIGGQPPLLSDLPPGCAFAPRCKHKFNKCSTEPGLLTAPSGNQTACWLAQESSQTSR